MGKTLIIIWAVLTLLWSMVMLSLNPSHAQNLNFWQMVMWVNFLISLNFFVSYPTLSKFQEKNSLKILGSLPSINLIVFSYSLTSGILAFVNYFSSGQLDVFYINYHLIIQMLISGVVVILFLFLVLAGQAAEAGVRGQPTRNEIVKNLRNYLLSAENLSSNDNLLKTIGDLIEYLEYKMPHPSSIDISEYEKILIEIDSLLADDEEDGSVVEEKVGNVLSKVKML